MSSPWTMHEKLKDCLISALVGELIGSGTYRDVYELRLDRGRVLKIESRGFSFSNVHEYSIWQDVQGTKWEKWFAPCLTIDGYGAALVQARTKPLRSEDWRAVKRLPSFLADLKPANFGMLDGRLVAHDYGNHSFFSDGIKNARMVDVGKRKHDPEQLVS